MNFKYLMLVFWIAFVCLPALASEKSTNRNLHHLSFSALAKDSVDNEPMYNLFHLSKVLARKKDNLKALGYLNQFFKKPNQSKEDRDYLMSFVDTSFVKNELREKFKLYFLDLKGSTENNRDLKISNGVFDVLEVDKDLRQKLFDVNKLHFILRNIRIREAFNNIIEKNNKDIAEYINNYNKSNAEGTLKFTSLRYIDSLNSQTFERLFNLNNLDLVKNLSDKSQNVDSIVLDSYVVNYTNQKRKGNLKDSTINYYLLNNPPKRVEGVNNPLLCIYIIYTYNFQEIESVLCKIDSQSSAFEKANKNSHIITLVKKNQVIKSEKSLTRYKNFFNNYIENYNGIKNVRSNITEQIINKYLENSGKIINEKQKFINQEINKSTQQIILAQNAIHNEQQRASGFKLPSESDVINALAQFMANRAKQETMIWFAETLKNRMQDKLIWDVFPNAKHILDGYDNNSVPDFNEIWRTSLSTDFVNMPSNLLNGEWIKEKAENTGRINQLNNSKQVLLFYKQFNKLVSEKSNYSAILENTYELINHNNHFKTSDNSLKSAINLLYLLANEFYTINGNNISYIDFGQIKNIDSKEWEVLLRLIKVKYGNEIYNDFLKVVNFKDQLFIDSNFSQNTSLITNLHKIYDDVNNSKTLINYILNSKDNTKLDSTYLKILKEIAANNSLDSTKKKSIVKYSLDTINLRIIESIIRDYVIEDKNIILNSNDKLALDSLKEFSFKDTLDSIEITKANKLYKQVNSVLNSIPNSTRIGNVLTGLTRLQTLSRAANTESSFSLVWTNMMDLLKFVDPDYDEIKNNFNYKKYKEIGQLQNFHQLYEHLHKKDFKLAFKSLLDIAEPFYSINNYTITVSQSDKPNKKGNLYLSVKKNTTSLDSANAKLLDSVKIALSDSLKVAVSDSNKVALLNSLKVVLRDSNYTNLFELVEEALSAPVKKTLSREEKEALLESVKQALLNPKNSTLEKNILEFNGNGLINKAFGKLLNNSSKFEFSFDKNNLELVVNNFKNVLVQNTSRYNVDDLREEFKKVRYGYTDSLQNRLTLKNLKLSNPFVSEFITKTFNNSEAGTITNEQYITANLIVDILSDPKVLLSKNFYSTLNLNQVLKANNNMTDNSMNKLVKLSSAFSDMMHARDENDLYKVIENLAAPRESYRLKRMHRHSFSLNGYVGGFVGYQHANAELSDIKSSFIYGVTAPIGLTYSQKNWGIFLQAIELGNVVNHYLWNNVNKVDKPKLSFKEVFSPGASLLYNIANSPFVAFVGCKLVQLDTRFDENLGFINTKNFDILDTIPSSV